MSHTTQKKNRMNKYSTVSYRNILAVYCFVSKGIWFACFRERVLFIGTRFSNLMKRPRRGQTLEEDEIKELKLKFKQITYSIMKWSFYCSYRKKNLLEIRVAKYCFTALVNRTLLFLTAILTVYCFVPKGTNYSHVFPWWNRLLGKEKKLHVNIFLSSYRVTGAGICVFFPPDHKKNKNKWNKLHLRFRYSNFVVSNLHSRCRRFTSAWRCLADSTRLGGVVERGPRGPTVQGRLGMRFYGG